jgi:hypothetical protein
MNEEFGREPLGRFSEGKGPAQGIATRAGKKRKNKK